MGIMTGLQARCERCGLTEFFPDKEERGDADVDYMHSNWSMVEGRQVCPNCKVTYDARMHTFFNEIFDK